MIRLWFLTTYRWKVNLLRLNTFHSRQVITTRSLQVWGAQSQMWSKDLGTRYRVWNPHTCLSVSQPSVKNIKKILS